MGKYDVYIYIIIYTYIYICVNYNDLTVLPNPGIMVWIRGIIPIWSYFRLVNYYNLPIYIYISAQIIARTAEATRQVAGISEVSP